MGDVIRLVLMMFCKRQYGKLEFMSSAINWLDIMNIWNEEGYLLKKSNALPSSPLLQPSESTGYCVPPCSIRSTPFRTTPTRPPVCTVSPPPPLNRYSTSARPSSHATLVCGGTSSLAKPSLTAVRISANARPLLAFRLLMTFRQDVTSGFRRRVSWISDTSSG